ncbi:MAG: alkaline phosphatase D family protein [Verrucomicrobiales bacterium]|nr:alkaline phosphatase D family protein [Verrucomicrobiales bacterium]
MTNKISRRHGLKVLGLGTLSTFYRPQAGSAVDQKSGGELQQIDGWGASHDRVCLGGNFWANPMEDWRVENGWAQCQTSAGNRSIHSLTHQLVNLQGSFSMSVKVGRGEDGKKGDGGGGFRIGVRSDINEHRSNCFAKGGINAGLVGGELLLADKKKKIKTALKGKEFMLFLSGDAKDGKFHLTLSVSELDSAETLASVTKTIKAENLLGNIALVSHFQGASKRDEKKAYRFSEWQVAGDAFEITKEHNFGPLLWSMYSLSDSRGDEGFVMKISALTAPLGEKDNQQVELFLQQDGEWKSQGEAKLDPDAWVATFVLPQWNEKVATPYKLVYNEIHKDGSRTPSEWSGIIKANPQGRALRLGALTCQNDYAFPYEPVANNLVKLDPDMLYFSGDQLYENHGGFGIIRDPADLAILNYLRKFYQFGWSFREAMKDRPTLCLPDDHDVFQGNIWGEGGDKMKDQDGRADSKGGYREPAKMVNVVHRTNTSHHPDPYDAKPSLQDISVYYGDLVYGGVSFAILGDRQWKSGPERVETGGGRADHVEDPDFDTATLDKPGLVLLGERQEAFLKEWAKDWRGHNMKVLLSQTVFSGVATHHGKYDGYLKVDLDSGAWPQTPRNRAIDIIRESKALHVNGDQHLTTLSQYGVKKQRDSNWSFCTPAIAVGYPRWWRPDEVGMPHQNRPDGGRENTGEYIDGAGNKVYVYAVGNPIVPTEKNRYKKAHQKGSGFGLVTIDGEKKTYTLDSFRFLVDAVEGDATVQFPGWPVTIQQKENGGDNVLS